MILFELVQLLICASDDVTTPDSHPADRERASPAHARDFAAPRHLSRQNAPDSPT